MPEKPIILFVCEHGAAKSVIAATYFDQMANEAGLSLQAIARGTNPDNELSEGTVKGLAKDKLIPVEPAPTQLSSNEVQSARRVVSFCEIPAEYGEAGIIQQWKDVPPVSQNYDQARDVIVAHVRRLVNELRSSR